MEASINQRAHALLATLQEQGTPAVPGLIELLAEVAGTKPVPVVTPCLSYSVTLEFVGPDTTDTDRLRNDLLILARRLGGNDAGIGWMRDAVSGAERYHFFARLDGFNTMLESNIASHNVSRLVESYTGMALIEPRPTVPANEPEPAQAPEPIEAAA